MTRPIYKGLAGCDGCDQGSGETPVKVWQVDGLVIFEGRAVNDPHVCRGCLSRLGHEAPQPRTAEDVA